MAGKGRSPCCDKTKVKRGPWSPSEDWKLMAFIRKHGHSNWRALPQQAGLLRCGKSCRLRWINYLRPDVKRGNFSLEEEETIINLHESMGNKWSKIASYLPGRTDNEIKNVWNTHLKKRLGRNGDQNRSKGSSTSRSSSSSASSSSCISYGDMNVDKGPGNHEAPEPLAGRTNEQEQDPQFSIPIMLAEYKPIDEPMEESLSSGGHSNASSNVQSLISVEEVSMPMQEEPTTLIYRNTTTQVQNSMTTEAEQQAKASDEKIEIPFDSDVDFWSLLGSLSPIHQPCEVQAQEPEVSKPAESTDFGEVAEYKKWLKYFESELGLAEGTENDYPEKDAEEELLMKALENDLMFKPEVHAASSMWPASPPPQDFGI